MSNDTEQKAKNADKNGFYELALQTTKLEINPGEEVEIFGYITGYGVHGGSGKVLFLPPTDMISKTKCKSLFFGDEPEFLGEKGVFLSFIGAFLTYQTQQ